MAPTNKTDEELALAGFRRVLEDDKATDVATTNAAGGLLRAIGRHGEAGDARLPTVGELELELERLDALELQLRGDAE